MKKILCILSTLCWLSSIAQLGVGVFFTGGSFIIKSNTIFSSDGLAIVPSSDFDLTAAIPNSLQRYPGVLPAHPVSGNYIQRVYRWQNNTPNFSGDVTINYRDAELNGLVENQLTLNIYGTNHWQQYLTPVTRDAAFDSVFTAGVPSTVLNELTLASFLVPLPVHWATVSAERTDRLMAIVKWSTYEEENVRYYSVEKSMDGTSWKRTGTYVYASRSSGNHNYQITDTAGPSKIFYRIKETNLDGSEAYSKIVNVNTLNQDDEIKVYPNPANDQIYISNATTTNFLKTVAIYNTEGSLIKKENTGPVHLFKCGLTGLPSGTYIIKISTSDKNNSIVKILKAN